MKITQKVHPHFVTSRRESENNNKGDKKEKKRHFATTSREMCQNKATDTIQTAIVKSYTESRLHTSMEHASRERGRNMKQFAQS